MAKKNRNLIIVVILLVFILFSVIIFFGIVDVSLRNYHPDQYLTQSCTKNNENYEEYEEVQLTDEKFFDESKKKKENHNFFRSNYSTLDSITTISLKKQEDWMDNISKKNFVKDFLLPHKPISINGNDDFTGLFGLLPNIRKGVIKGDGTKENPFIISGWRINASKENGICITGTTVYCIVKDCNIYDGGNNNMGVFLSSVKNVKIQNITSSRNEHGISLHRSSMVEISNINTDFNNYGIYLQDSADNLIASNHVEFNGNGLYLEQSSENNIISNDVLSNYYGISIENSANNIMRYNSMEKNKRNFFIIGNTQQHYINDINDSNTANGKPFQYIIEKKDMIFDGVDAGFFGFISCSNITIKNTDVSDNGNGILLYNCNDFLIENIGFYNDEIGIYIQDGFDNLIKNNFFDNFGIAISLNQSSNNAITTNKIYNGIIGCQLYHSRDNVIVAEEIHNTIVCMYLEDSTKNLIIENNMEAKNTTESWFTDVIYLKRSPSNTITNNILKKGWNGILLESNSSNQVIEKNNITSGKGIYIGKSCPNNFIEENRIENNIYEGIDIYSDHNFLLSNILTGHANRVALFVGYCSNNTLQQNSFMDNIWNLKIRGDEISHYFHSISSSNTANGIPVCYLIDKENIIINNNDFGFLGIVDCRNISVKNATINYSGQGILCAYSYNISITNCFFSNNEYSIYCDKSSNCYITDNSIKSNIGYPQSAVFIASSYGNIISNNSQIHFDGYNGIRLKNASYNIIENNRGNQISLRDLSDHNIIKKNYDCTIDIDDSSNISIQKNYISRAGGVGIIIQKYSNVLVEDNYVANSLIGGMSLIEGRNSNTFKNNTITNNSDYGIQISYMEPNSIHIFLNNNIGNNGGGFWKGAGVICSETDISNIQFHHNLFENNTWAIFVNRDCNGIINATENWWGDESGPLDPSPFPPCFNPRGKGDKVTDWVKYRPWMENPPQKA